MAEPTRKDARKGFGAIANIAVLERELGKLEYERRRPASAAVKVDELARRQDEIVVLLDREHARRDAAAGRME